mgnify:CR=1 FL=1
MRISVPLVNGLLPDKYGKYSAASDMVDGKPLRSFPIKIEDAPSATKSFALIFIDYDAVPVGGFMWIHWLAANIPANTTEIPENNSQELKIPMVQGKNSTAGPLVGNRNPVSNQHYNGPQPPDKTHDYELKFYALDSKLDIDDGFWLNELRRKIAGHILDEQRVIIPSRK